MQTPANTTVAEVAAGSPAAVRVFERHGIDYCCGGKRPLADACREKGVDPAALEQEIAQAGTSESGGDARDWSAAPLADLINHIVDRHHTYLRSELPLLAARIDKVYRVYNERYGPTLTGLPEVFAGLQDELTQHMRKEEYILFPAVAAYEDAANSGRNLPSTPFGTVGNPIRMMEHEHDSAGGALRRIREITQNFAIPDYACPTYKALMSGLEELERDLHLHIHLENNLLFPAALRLESGR